MALSPEQRQPKRSYDHNPGLSYSLWARHESRRNPTSRFAPAGFDRLVAVGARLVGSYRPRTLWSCLPGLAVISETSTKRAETQGAVSTEVSAGGIRMEW